MGLAAGTWLGISFNEPNKPMMISAAFIAGICAAAVLYHGTIRRVFTLADSMSEALETQHQTMKALMEIKVGEISQGIAEQLQTVTNFETIITKH